MKRIHPRAPARLLPVVAAVVAALAGLAAPPAHASSHREAPAITTTPKVDGTDFYMFNSYEPGRGRLRHAGRQLPAAAGRLRRPELLQARSERAVRDPRRQQRRRQGRHHLPVPLQQHAATARRCTIGGTGRRDPADAVGQVTRAQRGGAQRQRDLHRRRRPRRPPHRRARPVTNAAGGSDDVRQAGRQHRHRRRFPNYAAYAAQHIYNVNIPGCATPGKVFVGQRKDPFAVNLGVIFDLLNVPARSTSRPPKPRSCSTTRRRTPAPTTCGRQRHARSRSRCRRAA